MKKKKTQKRDNILIKSAGQILKKIRTDKEISLRQLEEGTKINRGLLSRYENNEVNIELDVLERIAVGLNIPAPLIIVEWLKEKHPKLRNPENKIGQLLNELSKELTKGPVV